MLKISHLKYFVVGLFLASCGSNNSPEPTQNVGSNLLHQSFVEISSNEFFIPQESSVRILTANNSYLKLSEKLAIDKTFTKILGDKNTIYLQSSRGIEILKKKDKEETYEVVSTISQVSKCDLLALGQDYLAVTAGGSNCSNSVTSSINFYDNTDAAKPTFKYSVNINSPVSIKTYYKLVFIAEGTKGFRILEFDGKNKPSELFRNESKAANQIFYYPTNKTLIVKNDSEVLQYAIDNISKPTFLSTIKIGK